MPDFKKNIPNEFRDPPRMSRDEAREEIEALREGIEYHNYLYYVKDHPLISDAAYDKLFRRLQELEETFPEFQSDVSPTRRVGGKPVTRLKKLRHAAPMLSLNAVTDKREVSGFLDSVRRNSGVKEIIYVFEPKFDGVSVEIVYENGLFRYAATRGDGETGEDITESVRTVRPVLLQLQNSDGIPRFLALRGEIFMTRTEFKELNKERVERNLEPFANPRNATAGLLRQLDPRMVAGRPFDVRFYEVLRIQGLEVPTHWEMLQRFESWGLKTDPHNRRCTSLEDIEKYYQGLLEKRDELEYEIDGVVIKVDDYRIRERLGTRERSPRWALAWKFPPREEASRVEDIVVQVGRTGVLTPVALLQPADVGGVTISRATLHNEAEIHRKDIRIGDKVRIVRAGDVIPEVLERVDEPDRPRVEKFSMPRTCPACGTEVVKEGAYYRCPGGLLCPPQLAARITHYASREAMDIEGLSTKTAQQLVEKGFVREVADLYKLSLDDILKLEGFAQKSATRLYEAIQGSKKARLDRFIYALGIRHAGRHVAQVLAKHFRTLEALQKASREELSRVPDIGREIASSIADFFSRDENKEVIRRLIESGIQVEEMPGRQEALHLEGKTFVFTGSLEKYTRAEAEQIVESLGGKAASSVSGETDFVVAGKEPGSKLDEAQKRGVRVLSEEEFEKLVSRQDERVLSARETV